MEKVWTLAIIRVRAIPPATPPALPATPAACPPRCPPPAPLPRCAASLRRPLHRCTLCRLPESPPMLPPCAPVSCVDPLRRLPASLRRPYHVGARLRRSPAKPPPIPCAASLRRASVPCAASPRRLPAATTLRCPPGPPPPRRLPVPHPCAEPLRRPPSLDPPCATTLRSPHTAFWRPVSTTSSTLTPPDEQRSSRQMRPRPRR